MKDAYTPEEIREMQKRIKALEEALREALPDIMMRVQDIGLIPEDYHVVKNIENLLNSKP